MVPAPRRIQRDVLFFLVERARRVFGNAPARQAIAIAHRVGLVDQEVSRRGAPGATQAIQPRHQVLEGRAESADRGRPRAGKVGVAFGAVIARLARRQPHAAQQRLEGAVAGHAVHRVGAPLQLGAGLLVPVLHHPAQHIGIRVLQHIGVAALADRIEAAMAVGAIRVHIGAHARRLLVDDQRVVDEFRARVAHLRLDRQRALEVLQAQVQVVRGGTFVLAPGAGGRVRLPVVGAAELRGRRGRRQDRADDAQRRRAAIGLLAQRHAAQARGRTDIRERIVDGVATLVTHAQVLRGGRRARIDLPLEGAVHALAFTRAFVVGAADMRQLAQHLARGERCKWRRLAQARGAAVGAHREHVRRAVVVLHRIGPVVAVDGDVEQRAHLAKIGVPAIADQKAAARAVLVGRIAAAVDLVDAVFDVAGGHEALGVERRAQADIHGAGDAAFELVGGGRFVDFHAADRLHRQILVRQAAPGRSEDLVAVEGRGDVGQAADGDVAGLAAIAPDLHARHALQRVARMAVGELADVVGVDRIDHLRCIALDVLG